MRILVTGGSGFIGTNLVPYLLENGQNVSIYDERESEAYPELCMSADIRNRERLTMACNGVNTIYHLAAVHRDDVNPVSLYYDVNVGGATNLVFAAQENNVDRIVYTSTVAIYGLKARNPDESSPPDPFNDYAKSKYESEQVLIKWANRSPSRSLVIVRPTVIFGEGNRGNMYNLLRFIASNKSVMVGNGKNSKSMAYVLNLTRFLATFAESPPGIEIYNYADEPNLTVEELVKIMLAAIGKQPKIQLRVPYALALLIGYVVDFLSGFTRTTYPISSIRIRKFCADTTVSTERLRQTGFSPPYTLTEGLNRMISNELENIHDH